MGGFKTYHILFLVFCLDAKVKAKPEGISIFLVF